jgi:hypothetical protein
MLRVTPNTVQLPRFGESKTAATAASQAAKVDVDKQLLLYISEGSTGDEDDVEVSPEVGKRSDVDSAVQSLQAGLHVSPWDSRGNQSKGHGHLWAERHRCEGVGQHDPILVPDLQCRATGREYRRESRYT